MYLSTYEVEKVEAKVRAELRAKGFSFDSMELKQPNEQSLMLSFIGARHITYKNVRLMTYMCTVKETTMYTQVYINLRFLYGEYVSPVVGFKIVSFKFLVS